MRTTIKAYIEAAKARKENGEEGFSLVELIVVVVILGILAAVAIPIFNGIQATAEKNAAEAAAANKASEIAASMASGTAAPATIPASGQYTFAWVGGTPATVDKICLTATKTNPSVTSLAKGPGCAS